ncbi:NAD kinase [Pseudohoeflea coraliihabitans]|uniref:NAD kinase n=1 Tax=Pseudohoeflea coraliihabitans TaxID=2860393 RepID=A0ABS6WSL5_9HYPH|nr:NAD kinase [Pseudohoeflea sp. DP4N28-3]MBW3098948.1 NAD kinase [Pseudohoeflea sp. DP4N28-3]
MDGKITFIAASTPEAQAAARHLAALYGNVRREDAEVIVALGGDGFMLATLHDEMNSGRLVYGMNRGSVGFLMNDYSDRDLHGRLAAAVENVVRPLEMQATDMNGEIHRALAINEVSLFRQSYQAAKLRISIDGKVRMEELICDGVMVATPAGSTAYNLSAHGPILPLDAPLLALTPVSAFRPRRWRGALLPHKVHVSIEVLEADKRPVNAVADHSEAKSVVRVEVAASPDTDARILTDASHSLNERILNEQFQY